MSAPTEAAPWYGRSTANGQTLVVAGSPTHWHQADMSIPGGWPMVNDGRGWQDDRDARRIPYSPHPDIPWISHTHKGAEQTSPSKGDQVT
ncbi:hypothetical protein [Streptomyces sp. Wb2n-11]|uniref:hypothetical protein n=1 Tax=Streptomyces sp. Wb2n-11 TaxID=1030533 RepID=UPI000A80C161|nr:hypothetical protein [Streptomyces sp. Wb2n-11]